MPQQNIEFFNPFLSKKRKAHIIIESVVQDSYETWLKNQNRNIQNISNKQGFSAKAGQVLICYGDDSVIEHIFAGRTKAASQSEGSKIREAIKNALSKETLEVTSFEFHAENLEKHQLNRLQIGWGLAAYKFMKYKKPDESIKHASLVLSAKSDKSRVKTTVESICLIRDLINIPANDMGPDELEAATEFFTTTHELKLKIIKDKDLLKKNFPMIYDVGKGSTRRPRLLDFSWGNKNHPKVALVGKGVCFDTGGLDIKPSQFMLNMKKDMGGAAHVIALAHMIISLKLPIQLRVLIPTVENSISGDAYRPADVLQTRKGITVEVGNTDAEGRLVLGDALTYACEDKPELIIDFATLTGAARVAVGTELPALFSNNDDTAYKIQKLSAKENVEDPVWHLPLWKPYRSEMESSVADISSTGGKAGATIAALFLNEFIEEGIEWIHMDAYAWEDSGKAGRPKGGADTGMRAIFAYLEERYK